MFLRDERVLVPDLIGPRRRSRIVEGVLSAPRAACERGW